MTYIDKACHRVQIRYRELPGVDVVNVSLSGELDAYVAGKVESGDYASASEVVRMALRLLKERDAEQQARLEALRAMVKVGTDQLNRGERIGGKEAFAKVRQPRSRKR